MTEVLIVNGSPKPHKIFPVDEDGSCLFASLSHCLHGNFSFKNMVRNVIEAYVEVHWDDYKNFTSNFNGSGKTYDSKNHYRQEMLKPSTYGTTVEIDAAAAHFSLFFEVYQNGQLLSTFGSPANPVKRLRLSGSFDCPHFELCEEIDKAASSVSNDLTNVPRSRGRPKKNVYEKVVPSSSDLPNVPRSRGRPKKNVNEKVVPSSSDLPNVSRPRGRPKKRSHEDAFLQVERDKTSEMPCGAAPVPFVEEETNSVHLSDDCDTSNVSNPQTKMSAKKKPGRPRKKMRVAEAAKAKKECRKKYASTHPAVNREAVARYTEAHPQVNREAVARYTEAHPQVNREAVARYTEAHPQDNREAVARYTEAHREVPRQAVQRYDATNERRQLRKPWQGKKESGFNYDADTEYESDKMILLGDMTITCNFCYAKKWKGEYPTMCCGNGKVQLDHIQKPPDPLFSLLFNSHPDSKHFMNNIRKYNSAFQMTSFGAKEIFHGNFMPTVKIQGQVYHRIGSLLPSPGEDHKFLQIYFLGDDEKETDARHSTFKDLKKPVINQLQRMLHENNSHIKDLKAAIENASNVDKDFHVVIHAQKKPVQGHKGCYNKPTVSEVAVVMVGDSFDKRDIILQGRDGTLQRISETHRSYDAYQYPLIFSRGEDGYSIDIKQVDPKSKQPRNKTVSAIDFYAYHLMIRDNYDHLLNFKSLLNQFVVDMYAKVEAERLNFLRHNQAKLRAENYIHLKDAISKGDTNVSDLGQMVILPSSFTGGPRYMHERIQDAMTYVRKYGRPDLFITFTCNPKWPEITNELKNGQTAQDRHDIVTRVFRLKVKALMDLIKKGEIFGSVRCDMHSIEWQKRGLPHAHLLVWLRNKLTSEQIDSVVRAEIPDPADDPLLHEIVKTNMIHGPCGAANKKSPCMSDGKCTKMFPKRYVKETQTGEDSYPLYRRRSPAEGGFTAKILRNGNEIVIDNRWIVPFNPVLLRCFNAHINVEICNSVKSIRYICKYVNKGSDMATFSLKNEKDEIELYQTGRYICSSEAFWRIFAFPVHERDPSVFALAIHLENGQRVYFTPGNVMSKLDSPPTTTLLGFFQLCQNDAFAKTICYSEVPSYYTWQKDQFVRRKLGEVVPGYPDVKKSEVLGRVYTIHPTNSECFYLRILLHEIPGPTSFEYLKTVQGVLHPTFQAACKALGLLEDDDHWDKTLEEAALLKSAKKLRELFAVMLIFCNVSDQLALWQKFKESFSEDILLEIRRRNSDPLLQPNDGIFNEALVQLEDMVLSLGGQTLTYYNLPEPQRQRALTGNQAYEAEMNYDVNQLTHYIHSNENLLTPDQQKVYLEVLTSVEQNLGHIFFLDAPGGTGKTFLINLLLAKVRSGKKIAIAAASSGIAATLLPGGKTAHSAFKLPLNLNYNENPVCSVSKQSSQGRVLRDASLIIWDECTMSHKKAPEALSRTLKDIRNNNNTVMGGVTMLFSGDYRQTLPVIPRGTRADEVNACLKNSFVWGHIRRLSLSTNMRVHTKADDKSGEFASLLLKIGNGELTESNGRVQIPADLGKVVTTLDDLIAEIYPDVSSLTQKNLDWFRERAILAPRNDFVTGINEKILDSFQADEMEYKSVDTVMNDDEAVNYPVEFLNSLTPPGIPAHKLKLKVGAPIMLLRNLLPPKLCNGTRLQVKSLQRNVIEAIIFTGSAIGETAFIPRIPMIPSDYPFEFKRLQFPVKLSFAMTINKSQGQSLRLAGIDLRQPCFSHGQFYVACSRVSNSSSLVILTPDGETANVVYQEALTDPSN